MYRSGFSLGAVVAPQNFMFKAFQLDDSAFDIANRLKVFWDVIPFVLHNKGGAGEMGENLEHFPEVLYWLQRVHWLVMALLFPAAMGRAGADQDEEDDEGEEERQGLERMLTIGVGTHDFFHASIFTTEAGHLGLNIGDFLQNICITHPMHWWLGVVFENFRLVLQGFSMAFGDAKLTATIAALTEADITDTFGSHFSFLFGTTIIVELPGNVKFLMTSANALARVIGCSGPTVRAHLRGEKQGGTIKTPAEMAAGVTGEFFERVRFKEYEGGRLAIVPAGGNGAASTSTQEALEFVCERRAFVMATEAGATRKPDTAYGRGAGSFGGPPPNAVVFVDKENQKLLAFFPSTGEASISALLRRS